MVNDLSDQLQMNSEFDPRLGLRTWSLFFKDKLCLKYRISSDPGN